MRIFKNSFVAPRRAGLFGRSAACYKGMYANGLEAETGDAKKIFFP